MGYILKNTSALLTTKITDAARKKISQGKFSINYFQIGDSEVCYDCDETMNLTDGMVIESEYTNQNLSPLPEKNKSNIKYPIYVTSNSTNTFGIPIQESYIDEIFNTAAPRGFFSTGSSGSYSAFTTSAYTLNPNFEVNLSNISSGNTLVVSADVIDGNVNGQVQEGDFLTIYYGNSSSVEPILGNLITLTYKVLGVTGNTSGNTGSVTITLDRELPDLDSLSTTGSGRVLFYPSGMTSLYDSFTPEYYWEQDAINFENNCDISKSDVKVWNMNIPWSESPAGVFSNTHQGYDKYESKIYLGTKEYLGYNSDEGQTGETNTFYYNSFSEKIEVTPDNQKTIAIVHYTNNSIDNFYGEKFALKNYDPLNPNDTGQARNFKVHLPTLMWHKSTDGLMGETFYVDPPGYDGLNLFSVQFIESAKNINMNNPGIRYYHLWDTNTNKNGYPNRVGKVWPDLKMITFDDEEIVAHLSYKSNRNWTLPAPKLGLIIPNTFNLVNANDDGILSGNTEALWVTYRFNNEFFTESLHCNYYSYITGNNPDCPPETADVILRFGNEFPFLNSDFTNTPSGFTANDFIVLAQKVTAGSRPDPTKWVELDLTNQMSATTTNGFITVSGLTGTTFIITKNDYETSELNGYYHLDNYIELPVQNETGTTLNFGGEYYFYGTIETDIQATIYVMNYLCNLGNTQFLKSSNPTWDDSKKPYVTEVGLYDENKDLMIITKVQSPELRTGVQQYSIKLDF